MMSSDSSGEKSTGYIPPPYVDPDDAQPRAQPSSQESNPNPNIVQLDPLPTSKHRYYTLRYRIGNSALRVFTPRCSGSA